MKRMSDMTVLTSPLSNLSLNQSQYKNVSAIEVEPKTQEQPIVIGFSMSVHADPVYTTITTFKTLKEKVVALEKAYLVATIEQPGLDKCCGMLKELKEAQDFLEDSYVAW
ncbi:hypothetical protein EC973_004808, partial [Apophysomyces ossiformis]